MAYAPLGGVPWGGVVSGCWGAAAYGTAGAGAAGGAGASSAGGAGGVTTGRAMAWAGSSGTAASCPVSDSQAFGWPADWSFVSSLI